MKKCKSMILYVVLFIVTIYVAFSIGLGIYFKKGIAIERNGDNPRETELYFSENLSYLYNLDTIEKCAVSFPLVLHWFTGGKLFYTYDSYNPELGYNTSENITVWSDFSLIDGRYKITEVYENP